MYGNLLTYVYVPCQAIRIFSSTNNLLLSLGITSVIVGIKVNKRNSKIEKMIAFKTRKSIFPLHILAFANGKKRVHKYRVDFNSNDEMTFTLYVKKKTKNRFFLLLH